MPGLTNSERERIAITLRGQIVSLFRSGKRLKRSATLFVRTAKPYGNGSVGEFLMKQI